MTAARKLPPLMTVDEFLDWPGDGTQTRYELVDGVLRAMAPGTNAHGIIQSNLIFAIGGHLRSRGSQCMVVTTPGIKPFVRAHWNFRQPDIGVSCAPDRKGDRHLRDPILLIEVISPSNASETYENIRAYATLPMVLELVVVHSTQMMVELLRKGDNHVWPADATIIGAEGTLSLASIDMALPLTDIYAGTHLIG